MKPGLISKIAHRRPECHGDLASLGEGAGLNFAHQSKIRRVRDIPLEVKSGATEKGLPLRLQERR